MYDYLKEVNRIVSGLGKSDNAGVMVVNRDGIVEYYKPCMTPDSEELKFGRKVVGRRLLDVYRELNEENSTVIKTLKTGQVTVGEQQTLTGDGFRMNLLTTTYPITDENGVIQGAVDVAELADRKFSDGQSRDDGGESALDDILTQNDRMKTLKHTIEEVALNDSPTTVYGETGTGKELVAKALHSLSRRREKPFISQNCAAIPANLLESIFFGTEKGGFTGAESRKGLFEMAHGGTLFLDEVNSMEPYMQAKLLKVLEDRKVRRIGGNEDIDVDVRILSASNENPEELERSGKMRSDFYYRISVVKLVLPPLRERPEDIMLLANHYIERYNSRMQKQIKGMTRMAEDLFCKWSWPGNVRELKNTIESAFNIEQGNYITLESLSELLQKVETAQEEKSSFRLSAGGGEVLESRPEARDSLRVATGESGSFPDAKEICLMLETEGVDLKELLEKYERFLLSRALSQNRKLKDAAEKLGISPQKLQYRMEKLNLK